MSFGGWNQSDVDRHNARVRSAAPPVPVSRSEKLENAIQEEIEEWLKTQVHRAWWDRKRMDRPTTSREGVPDFVGAFAGVPFGLEVKRPGEKASTEQLGELLWLRRAGAVTAVVFSRDEAVNFFLTECKKALT